MNIPEVLRGSAIVFPGHAAGGGVSGLLHATRGIYTSVSYPPHPFSVSLLPVVLPGNTRETIMVESLAEEERRYIHTWLFVIILLIIAQVRLVASCVRPITPVTFIRYPLPSNQTSHHLRRTLLFMAAEQNTECHSSLHILNMNSNESSNKRLFRNSPTHPVCT